MTNRNKWNDGHFVPVNPEFIDFVNRPKQDKGSEFKAPTYGKSQPKGTRIKKNSNGTTSLIPPQKEEPMQRKTD